MTTKKKKMLVGGAIAIAILVVFVVIMGMAFTKVEIAYEPNTIEDSIVQPVEFGHANIYFIETETGYILVDTGMPGQREKLNEIFSMVEVDPKNVELIILTHGHMDHIGMVSYAKEITDAEVLVHENISENIEQGKHVDPKAQNSFGHLLNFMTALLPMNIEGIEPDILMEDTFDLSGYGVSGTVIHTPGHSKGSVSIILDNGEAIIGDMVRPDDSGEIELGMFYDDKTTVITSLEKVASYNPKTIYLSHGETIDNEDLIIFISEHKEP